MRFKAKLATEQVQVLCSLATPLSRLHGSSSSSSPSALDGGGGVNKGGHGDASFGHGGSIVYLNPEVLRISVRGGSSDATDGISCFAELSCGVLFLDRRIESAAEDAIAFELDLNHLRTALQSVLSSRKGARAPHQPSLRSGDDGGGDDGGPGGPPPAAPAAAAIMVMKLAKRSGLPCLCLDATSSGGYGSSAIEVHHAIPVRVMRVAEVQYHCPPRVASPTVQLELPAERPLRAVVERLKSISPHVYVEGNMGGELVFRIDGDGASIRTYYSKLIPRFEECSSNTEGNAGDNDVGSARWSSPEMSAASKELARCVLKVDGRKLYTCLQWQSTLAMGSRVGSAVLCMIENEMLVMHVVLNPRSLGFFTYYVPVHFLNPDQLVD